jgi:flagellin
MSMRINTNLDALNAQRNLSTTGLAYAKSVQKLSSGMRINSASDDAAGLTISEKLRAQTAGLGQATRNAQDGISMIQTGEGALNETASILQRMRELTVQGGNDTLQASDRGAIKSEMDQLSSEIGRISGTTQFNGITLLNGSLSAKGTLSTLNSSGASGLTGLTTTALLTTATSAPTVASAAVVTGTAALATIGTGGVLTINGIGVNLTAGHSAAQTVIDINNTTGLGAAGTATASLNSAGALVLTANTKGSAGSVTVGSATGASNTIYANTGLTAGMNVVKGQDAPTSYAAAGGYTVNLTQNAMGATAVGTVASVNQTAAGTLTLNGVDVLVTSGATQANVIADINASKSGVTASANGVGDLVLTSKAVGSTSAISISSSGNTLRDLGMGVASDLTPTLLVTAAGTDAAGTYTAPGTTTTVAFSASNGSILSGGGLSVDSTPLALATVASTTGNFSGSVAAATIASLSTLTINTHAVVLAAALTTGQVVSAINAGSTGTTASLDGSGKLVLTFATAGSAGGFLPTAVTITSAGTTAALELGFGTTGQLTANTIVGTAGTDKAGTAATNNSYTFTDTNKAASLQIGANSGQTLGVGIEDMSAVALGVSNLDVSSSAAINKAGTGTLAVIDDAIATVSAQRATLGAYQNRLEHTISNLGVSQSNLTASESRIRDVDMAAEMVNFTKTGILQQAGQAILAQANQSGSGVMSLLR